MEERRRSPEENPREVGAAHSQLEAAHSQQLELVVRNHCLPRVALLWLMAWLAYMLLYFHHVCKMLDPYPGATHGAEPELY